MPQDLTVGDVVQFAHGDNLFAGSIIAKVTPDRTGSHLFIVQTRHVKFDQTFQTVKEFSVQYPASALILVPTPLVCDDDETLCLQPAAGIFGSSVSQWDQKLASPDYTDIAHRGPVYKQVSGYEDGFVLVKKQLVPVRIDNVDTKTNTTTILKTNKVPKKSPTSWFDAPTKVDSSSVLFRCTQDPRSVLLIADVMRELRKTEHYMSYSDIVEAVKKPTKCFQRSDPLDFTGKDPSDAFLVGNFDCEFGMPIGSRDMVYKVDRARYHEFTKRTGKQVLINLTDQTPVTSLEQAAKLIGGVLIDQFIEDENTVVVDGHGFRMRVELSTPDVFLFYIRDTTWNKPGPADLEKVEQMAASVIKERAINKAKAEASDKKKKTKKKASTQRGCDDDKTLCLHPAAGIFGSSVSQWDQKMASPDYTDIAHRGLVCKQVSGYEDGFVLVKKQLVPIRIVDVDTKTNTATILKMNKLPKKCPTSWYDEPTKVASSSVLFRCTQDPHSVLLTPDVMRELRKTEHYMSYSDIVEAVKKPTKYFQRSSPLDFTGKDPSDSFLVENFDRAFGMPVGSNDKVYKVDEARCYRKEEKNLTEKTPVTTLEQASELVQSVWVETMDEDENTVTVRSPDLSMNVKLTRPGAFLFYIRDTTWNKPGPADLEKVEQMAASVIKERAINKAKAEASAKKKKTKKKG